MFKKDTRVFLVDTDGIFDGYCCAGFAGKVCVKVVDRTLAVAAKAV
jgi:hypothetical protein